MHFPKRSDMATHSFTCKQAVPVFTPQPQSIAAVWLHCTNFAVPRRVEGWVALGGWLDTEIKWRPLESNPDTVTHPSTNRVQRRLTSLIESNALALFQTASMRRLCEAGKVTAGLAECNCNYAAGFQAVRLVNWRSLEVLRRCAI